MELARWAVPITRATTAATAATEGTTTGRGVTKASGLWRVALTTHTARSIVMVVARRTGPVARVHKLLLLRLSTHSHSHAHAGTTDTSTNTSIVIVRTASVASTIAQGLVRVVPSIIVIIEVLNRRLEATRRRKERLVLNSARTIPGAESIIGIES